MPARSSPLSAVIAIPQLCLSQTRHTTTPIMSEKKDEPSDEQILAAIAKESKEFDKVRCAPLPITKPTISQSFSRTPKSTASSNPSASMPTPSSTSNPASRTTTSKKLTA